MNKIENFRKENSWLSNTFPFIIDISLVKFDKPNSIYCGGEIFRSVEHAYKYAKFDDIKWKNICLSEKSPKKIIQLSFDLEKELGVSNIWNISNRLFLMTKLNEYKYSQEPFKTLLKRTGGKELIEGNDWGDKFWGVDEESGEGLNTLGTVLMNIREKLE